ncbi:hypothetical protein M413DRAFT_447257 [Hebeloma cylindrosporum]|uniref:Uncharacterized protein n=1 Tax=Hebeloma cylindrosporum TaxID=76867 RepID=A0A0C2XNS0_HEBCY|nr:hypothetical protein M413DRAFT_447257 [Hebeloma cylindrosporum h7]
MRRFVSWGGLGILTFLRCLVDAQEVEQAVLTKVPEPKDDWDFAKGPTKNSTHNLVFDTVGSFLQHWPNTRYRNGHNIVPGVVPIGTLLYHGTYRDQIPEEPEWTATDPEHAYLFCRSDSGRPGNSANGCWQLTLVTTRPLKVIYFDGSSAAKMRGGPMDSQDLVIWGRVRPEYVMKERERADKLCEWGKRYDLDGFVRMEMDFEIILCDFTAGVKPVSFHNLATVNMDLPPIPPGPRQPPPPSPTSNTTLHLRPSSPGSQRRIAPMFRVVESGSWHNHYPGDTRMQLDYSRMISFYDTDMFPSLQVARAGKGRLNHSLEGIAPSDVLQLQLHLNELLTNDSGVIASGIEWASLIKQIMQRYAESLELLHYILNSTSETDAEGALKQAHRHLTSMLAPYILHAAVPPMDGSTSHSWAAPIFEHCATTHTSHIETISTTLTYSEKLILQAIQGVSKEICRVLVTTWAEGMETDAIAFDLVDTESSPIQELLKTWKLRVEDLMAWLDWSYWRTCHPACSYEEMCYLPTWPFFSHNRGGPRPPLPGLQGSTKPLSRFMTWVQETLTFKTDETPAPSEPHEVWVDPQPSCIRRVEPLDFK